MKKMSPKRIHVKDSFMNPMATIVAPIEVVMAPIYSRNFLPILVNKNAAMIAPPNWSMLMMIGMAYLSEG